MDGGSFVTRLAYALARVDGPDHITHARVRAVPAGELDVGVPTPAGRATGRDAGRRDARRSVAMPRLPVCRVCSGQQGPARRLTAPFVRFRPVQETSGVVVSLSGIG